jgi:hypothetical protein
LGNKILEQKLNDCFIDLMLCAPSQYKLCELILIAKEKHNWGTYDHPIPTCAHEPLLHGITPVLLAPI